MIKLGEGGFGSVVASGDNAIKSFEELRYLINEVFVARYVMLASPELHTISLRKCSFSSKTMTVERWNCSLRKAMRMGLTRPQAISIHRCILRGLATIEQLFIIHADVKIDNVLVDDKFTTAILTDFGISSTCGVAKVRQTTPGHTPQEEAINHRTHDAFGFALLTLQLLYGYKPPDKIYYKQELRSVVSMLVKDNVMRRVLTMLLLDDISKAWSCKRALFELYGETLTVNLEDPKLFRSGGFEVVDGQIVKVNPEDATNLRIIEKCASDLYPRFFMNKLPRCIECTLSLVSQLELSPQKVKIYATVLLYVFYCVFGTTKYIKKELRMSESDILTYTGCSSRDVITCLNTLFKDDNIVRLIFAP